MGPLQRIRKTFLLRKILGPPAAPPPEESPAPPPAEEESIPWEEEACEPVPDSDPPLAGELDEPAEHLAPVSEEDTGEVMIEGEAEGEEDGPEGGRSGLTGWVERRAHRVVSKIYDSRADDLETRARRAVSSAYSDQADDLEDRAVRAMRRAITTEADRIKDVIEHSVQVKKREVRLSLLVLVTASLVYLALYWFTSRPSS